MNNSARLYDFLAGPCLYITVSLCIAGIARKISIVIAGFSSGLRFSGLQNHGILISGNSGEEIIYPASTLADRAPVVLWISVLFHVAIFTAPLTARAHGILLALSWGILPPRFSPVFTEIFTVMAIASGFFLLGRRVLVRHVLAVSSWRDFAAMICVLVPFITGFLAREMIGPYEIMMLIHVAGANLLLIAIGWTRVGHMVFFIAGQAVAPLIKKGGVS